MKAQRLFLGVWPDQATRKQLTRLIKALGDQSGRPQHPLDLHMTLVFLGMVEPELLECVDRVAGEACFQPFTMTIDRVGYWKRPRILWCGATQIPQALEQLVNELQNGLQRCGFVPEKRRFLPHITLARKVLPIENRAILQPFEWHAEGFVLARSNTGIAPPRYEILKKWGTDS